jgi:hypothetical protein
VEVLAEGDRRWSTVELWLKLTGAEKNRITPARTSTTHHCLSTSAKTSTADHLLSAPASSWLEFIENGQLLRSWLKLIEGGLLWRSMTGVVRTLSAVIGLGLS